MFLANLGSLNKCLCLYLGLENSEIQKSYLTFEYFQPIREQHFFNPIKTNAPYKNPPESVKSGF